MDKATFVGKLQNEYVIHVSHTSRGPKVLSSQEAGGLIIQDTREASKTLEKKLLKNKIPLDDVERIKKVFAELSENVPLDVPGGFTFVKHPIPKLQPKLNPNERIDNRLPALIAFEFLALLIGNSILDNAFDTIRKYIRYGIPTEIITVEQVRGKENDTFHAIVVEPINNTIRIHVRLFRWITFFVTFQHFVYRGLDSVYIEDLKSGKSLYAKTREEAKQEMWYELR